MNPIDKMMAWAQIWFTTLLLVFTFTVIMVYELGGSHLSLDQTKTLERWGDWLTGACFLALVFWFQRMRTGGIPDNSNVITQSLTAPDGTVTKITSPAHTPPASIPSLPTTAAAAPLVNTQQEILK